MSIVGRVPNVTKEQYRRILEVRAARAAIPSDKVLARELGMTTANVRSIMHRGLKYFERKP